MSEPPRDSAQRTPTFETTSRPWFGPRSRARAILAKAPLTEPVAPNVAIGAIADVVGPRSAGIRHIRFIDFLHYREEFRYRIAVCWTDDDPALRDLLYERAVAITERTGWYPLPQGSRLNSTAKERRRTIGAALSRLPSISGYLASVEPAVAPDAGCSVRVRLAGGDAILLDTGLPGRLTTQGADRLALITHAHADHAGGFASGRCRDLPVVMSPVTAEILVRGGHVSTSTIEHSAVLLRPGGLVNLDAGIVVEAFAVPHLPGAVGWVLRDDSSAVVFTGDICLTTARHSFGPRLQAICRALRPRNVTVLLDATMAGRSQGASTSSSARQVLDGGVDQVVLIAAAGEHLVYGYLDFFHEVQKSAERHSTSFVVSGTTRPLFEMLHAAFMRRDVHELDPFIAGQYGAAMSAWGESRWLYWSDRLVSPPTNRTLWFLTSDDVRRGLGPDVAAFVRLGRDDTNDDAELPRGWSKAVDVDTTAWTSHSNESSIADMCQTLDGDGCSVVLFHNFPKRISKFASGRSLRAVPLAGPIALIDPTPGRLAN